MRKIQLINFKQSETKFVKTLKANRRIYYKQNDNIKISILTELIHQYKSFKIAAQAQLHTGLNNESKIAKIKHRLWSIGFEIKHLELMLTISNQSAKEYFYIPKAIIYDDVPLNF